MNGSEILNGSEATPRPQSTRFDGSPQAQRRDTMRLKDEIQREHAGLELAHGMTRKWHQYVDCEGRTKLLESHREESKSRIEDECGKPCVSKHDKTVSVTTSEFAGLQQIVF
jgi:hypothetical protein